MPSKILYSPSVTSMKPWKDPLNFVSLHSLLAQDTVRWREEHGLGLG